MSTACWYFSIFEMALPWLCALALFKPGRDFPFLRSVVSGLTVYQLFLFLSSLILGHLGLLYGLHYRVAFATATGLALVGALYRIPAFLREVGKLRYKPHWYDIPTALCCIRAAQLVHTQWFNDWTYGTSGYDGMHYHIPRALQWLWHGDFRPYRTMIWQQLAHPYGGAGTLLASVLNGCGWLGGAYTALVLSLGAAASVILISRSFGIGLRGSIMAGLMLLSCPAVGLRMVDISTDIAATFPVIAAVALVRVSKSLPGSLFVFISLVGLGGSVKQYAVFSALPIGLALFGPATLRILKSPKALGAIAAGTAVSFAFLLLSIWPIHMAFGDFSGGGTAYSLSTLHEGWRGVRASLLYNFLQWSFEPLAIFPEALRKEMFLALGLDKVWGYFGITGPVTLLMPYLDRERMRAFMYSILFLPWLLMAVKKGYRIIVGLGFLLLVSVQVAPLAVNSVGARFAIIVLAAYSILWAARATISPILVPILVLLTLDSGLHYANRGYPVRQLLPSFYMEHEVNKDLQAMVGEEMVLVLGKAMALDAEIAGRFGQIRFEYVGCPVDGDWVAHFKSLKSQSRWFMMSAPPSEIVPGPDFATRLGPACTRLMPQVLRDAMTAAGWRYEKKVVREYELWTFS
jgi:hypothetical protein